MRVVYWTLLWMLVFDIAGAGERQLCHMERGASGEWHYRTKVDGKHWRCYYEGARMKPRDELYWAETPVAPSIIKMPWIEHPRWQGETE